MKTIEKYHIYRRKGRVVSDNDKNTVKEIRNTQIIINKEA
jgi:hypothetical protein